MKTHDHIMGAIDEALDSPEFRAILARCIYDRIAPKLEEDPEAGKETIVMHPRGKDPVGLAWLYRQKLDRRPYSSESETDLAGHMKTIMSEGATPELIELVLKQRGKSAEGIFEFKKRVMALVAKKPPKSLYADLEAATNAELARLGR